MLWNELTWEMQMQVVDKIEEVLLKETNADMQDAIVAAMNELEIWSNRECKISQDFEGFSDDESYVADASDQFSERENS